jgi:hypothetical protein
MIGKQSTKGRKTARRVKCKHLHYNITLVSFACMAIKELELKIIAFLYLH